MNTKFDNRLALIKIVEKLDTPAIEQILAFAAGYEAGKLEQISNTHINQSGECPA